MGVTEFGITAPSLSSCSSCQAASLCQGWLGGEWGRFLPWFVFLGPGNLSLGGATAREEENPAPLLMRNWARAESAVSCPLSQRVPAWECCPVVTFSVTFNVPCAIIKQLMTVFVKTCASFLKYHRMLLSLLCLGLYTVHYSTH